MINIAYTGWTWLVNHEDNQKLEFELFLKAMKDLNYPYVENFAFIKRFFDGNADEIKGLLDKYGVKLANLYYHFTDDDEKDFEIASDYVQFAKALGAEYLNLQGTMWRDQPFDRPTNPERVIGYAKLTERIGKVCKENGLKACFHPHANTSVYTQEQIEMFLENCDPEYAFLCLDTAHTTLAGMDPVAMIEKYVDRIGYMHLKDVDPNPEAHKEWPMDRFLPLGMGTVDFKGVYDALKEGGFNGIMCVELDNPPVCNYHAAMTSRNYLHNVLGF